MKEILITDLSSPEHAEALLYLLDSYARDIMGGGNELPEYTQTHLVECLKQHPGTHVVLAFVEGQPAGLAICFEGFSTFASRKVLNIHDFTVAPEYRGRGLAKELLKKIEELALQCDCCKLTLEVLEGNKIAQHVYRAFGFEGYELDPEMGRALFFEKKLNVD